MGGKLLTLNSQPSTLNQFMIEVIFWPVPAKAGQF